VDTASASMLERAAALADATRPHVADIDREVVSGSVAYKHLRSSGLLGLLVPTAFGGDGGTFSQYTEVLEKIAQTDLATALGFNMHNVAIGSLCETGDTALPEGAARFRAWVFDQVINEQKLFASATSEAGAGAKLSRLRTTYRPDGDGWVLSGVKSFVSLAGVADYFIVAARAADDDAEHEISHFVVAADDPGVRFGQFWNGAALAGTSTATMFLEDVPLGQERLMMNVQGMSLMKLAREPHWMISGYTGAYLGLAASMCAELIAVVSRDARKSADPVVVQQIGRLVVELRATRALVRAAGVMIDTRRGTPEAAETVHAAKYRTGELLAELADACVRLGGTVALNRAHPLERMLREAPFCRVMPAKPAECLEYVGKSALGVNMRDIRNFTW
jgi:alkylation response protein AidB-like acyl-CoA dehydrogenase